MKDDLFVSNDVMSITVTRKSQLMDKQMPMDILINGYRAGQLKSGETSTFQVPGGQAILQAVLALNKSRPLYLDASGKTSPDLMIESRMSNLMFFIGTAMVLLSTFLLIYTNEMLYMLIAVPPALYNLYLRFLQKDNYLIIKEVKKKASGNASPFQLPIR